MRRINKVIATVMLLMTTSAALAQQPVEQKKGDRSQALGAAAASSPAVTGSGTLGQLTKWVGSNSGGFILGDSQIGEDKFGNLGIGTAPTASKLTVAGMIQTTLGGIKFPDGTVQTTAALSSIFHNDTLTGVGTPASPLGIATGGVGTVQLANNAVTGDKIANGQVVRSVNGLTDNVTLAAGANISLTQTGNTITIDTTGSDVPVPFVVSGSVNQGGVISATNTAEIGFALTAKGGRRSFNGRDGGGILAQGADSPAGNGHSAGVGLVAMGGFNHSLQGPLYGSGIMTFGGDCDSAPDCTPGLAIEAFAGFNPNRKRGMGATIFGDVQIAGNLNVVTGTKNFKIDHPLDPENKYLYHAAIESSEVLNVYSGNITTDDNGNAVVQLPDWFEAINKDFRYQLTVIGSFHQAIVAAKIKDNAFTIKTNGARVEVSWQVTGVRSDAAMRAHPFKLEEDKTEQERGLYLDPDAYNAPEDRGIGYARDPARGTRTKPAQSQADRGTKP